MGQFQTLKFLFRLQGEQSSKSLKAPKRLLGSLISRRKVFTFKLERIKRRGSVMQSARSEESEMKNLNRKFSTEASQPENSAKCFRRLPWQLRS